jgi:sugar phosphate permease
MGIPPYAWVLTLSVVLLPLAIAAFASGNKSITMACLGAAMFFIFLCTGPVNTLIIESVPVNLRSSAMAMSIFLIHLFGDRWSSEIVGHLSDSWGSLQKAVMILPGALGVAALLWLTLALKTKQNPKIA